MRERVSERLGLNFVLVDGTKFEDLIGDCCDVWHAGEDCVSVQYTLRVDLSNPRGSVWSRRVIIVSRRSRILDKVGDDQNVVEVLNSNGSIGHARCVVCDQ